MKKQTLRLLSFVLIFSMLVSYIQLPAIAQDGEQESAYLISFVNEESAYDYVENSAEAQLIAVTPPLVVADITSSQAESLSEEDFVESVEEDIFVHANTEEDIFVYANTGAVEDGDILHWNAEAVGAKSAHEAGFKGSGVKVAVLDSGVDLYSEVMVKDGVDFVDPENGDGDDMTGHGTAVTGIIAAPDDGEGVLGIAPQADIYSVRVLDDENKAPISRIIAGIDWCIEKKVDIINMSFGTSQYSALLEEKIEQAAEAGILMVSSAGNGDLVEYPAKFPEVIAVSSLTSSMILSDSSASGEEVEISAPGENIYTTSLIGGYGAFSGTSIAAPHVTAAAAVLLSKDTSKPTDFIRELLSASAKETSDTDSGGNGILDITYALDLYDDFAENYKQPEYIPTQNPAPVETFEEKDIYVTGSWSSAGHNGLIDGNTTLENISLIKQVGVSCDTRDYLSDHPGYNKEKNPYRGSDSYHGIGNYVAAARFLYTLARKYKFGISFEEETFDNLLKVERVPYSSTNREDIESDINYMVSYYSEEGKFPFYMLNSKKKTIVVLGMLLHLLGDIYAHRAIVPINSVSVSNRTTYGNGIGGNEGRYFVVSDFVKDCEACLGDSSTSKETVEREFEKNKEILKQNIRNGETVFQRIWLFIQYIFFLLFGRSFVFVDDTIKNRTFLKYAMLLPKNTKKFCNGMPCYGAMKSIVQLGVLQFKDIKYFLKSNRAAEAQRYYEDNAPSNVFYNRRYLVAKEVANQFIADFIENKAFSPINFLPIYTDTMCGYYLKIDQLYNYLKDTNKVLDSRTNTILKESFWENRSDSLFNYSTIVYNGSYFVDPSTYSKDEKPLYNFVFPQGTGKSSKDFYLK